jgi:hypothetical protein
MPKKNNDSRASGNQRSQGSRSGQSKKPSGSSASNRGGSSSTGEGLDDLTYNVVTVLHEKSKGLEAYETYIEDASDNEEVRQIFEELRDQDQEAIGRLKECLQQLIGSGGEEMEEEEDEEGVA